MPNDALRSLELPAVPKHSTPYAPKPQCPENCSGVHDIDAMLGCPKCGGDPCYALVRHEWAYTEGHYFYALQPINGAPKRSGKPLCPGCGEQCVRL